MKNKLIVTKPIKDGVIYMSSAEILNMTTSEFYENFILTDPGECPTLELFREWFRNRIWSDFREYNMKQIENEIIGRVMCSFALREHLEALIKIAIAGKVKSCPCGGYTVSLTKKKTIRKTKPKRVKIKQKIRSR